MKLSEIPKRRALVLICLLGVAYVGITLASIQQYASDQVTDTLKLVIIVILCVVGFRAGREYLRFTRTTTVFLGAMLLLILVHITELTEEFAAFRSVPLFGEVTLTKRIFETTLMAGSLCLFVGGNLLSVFQIEKTKRQLESNLHRLQERELRYRTLFETANDAILIMQGDRFVNCNSKTLGMFDCAGDQIIGETPYRFSPPTQPDGQNSKEKALQKLAAVRAGDPQFFEWRHQRLDGTVFDAEVSLNLVELPTGSYIQAIVRDVSERRRAEEALRESTARLRSVFDSSPLAITVMDLDWNITDCSRAALDTYGFASKREALGRAAFEFVAEKDRDHARTKMAELPEGGAVQGMSFTLVRKDGAEFPAELSVSLMRDRKGRALGLVGISTDITERKKAERDRLDYQRKLRSLASELLLAEERERRRVATGLHDHACQTLALSRMKLQELRAPLPPADMDKIASICDTLDKTIGNLRELIFDLSSPTLYRFGLEAGLEELLHDKLKAEQDIQYRFHDDGAAKPVAEDVRVVLFQSVRELLINAIKHAHAHEVTLDIARCDGFVKITITDDGIGFDVEDALSTPSRSRGFGLFNIKERLDYIGGSLDVDSRSGQGSRFTLTACLETQPDPAGEPHVAC
jgi:PAS domain S-box-containing protein